MMQPNTKASGTRVWHVGVCLLLGVLFLYNPFFTVHDASGNLQVRHPLSYRATTASSELRRCTFDPARPLIPTSGVLEAKTFGACVPPARIGPVSSSEQQQPPDFSPAEPQQVVLEGLWFRPPPVLAS
jgi:hypothetical protein